MITGEFNLKGELAFEIDFIAADESIISVEAIFDTGFTGWLLINNKDAIKLGWKRNLKSKIVQTAGGQTVLNMYQGIVVLDGEEFTIPVYGGDEIQEILLGVRWLQFKRLIADYSGGVLTLD